MRRDSDAGIDGVGSSAGTMRCASMIAGTPAAIAARNGGSSTRSRRARSTSMIGKATCESTVAAP